MKLDQYRGRHVACRKDGSLLFPGVWVEVYALMIPGVWILVGFMPEAEFDQIAGPGDDR